MQLLRRSLEKTANIACGLADALFVFDHGDAHIAFAMFAEADTGRHGDVGLLDQQLGELDAAERANGSGIGDQANIEARGAGTCQPARPKLSTSTSRRFL